MRTFGPPSNAGLLTSAGALAAESAIPNDEVAAVNAGVLTRNDLLVQGIFKILITREVRGTVSTGTHHPIQKRLARRRPGSFFSLIEIAGVAKSTYAMGAGL